jgi:3-oxocholest-4-en-26-oate---CoA ligase
MGDALDTFNLADIWEAAAEQVADREALVVVAGPGREARRLTYAELEERANKLAHWLSRQGVGSGDHVGLYLMNGSEYLEAMLAAYKLRAVPINVNYRYVADELRYLFDDADLVGVVYERQFAPRVAEVIEAVPSMTWALAVEDGSGASIAELGDLEYEAAIVEESPEADFDPRSSDDPYIIYTGGTTGLPKGVVWRHEDAFFACIGGGDPMRLQGPVSDPSELVDRIIDGTFVYLPVAPLMHAAGQWTALSWLFAGGKVVLLPGSLDPELVWTTVEEEKVNLLTVVGDPVVRPLVDQWEEAGGYDASSLFSVGSGGAPLTPALKQRLVAALPNVTVADGFGSSETGAQGTQRLAAGADASGGVRFAPYGETTKVLDEDTRRPVEPGSGQVGRVALRGRIPQGYYNDPVKTASTFAEFDGHRWVLTGDMATVEPDGTIALLGRGSGCINTGGEKVFPEEVEAVLKSHPAVYDVVVVGADDERWGQQVVAIVALVEGAIVADDELAQHVRGSLAGYKVPKRVVLVDQVVRSPAGKADHRWAKDRAER